MFCPRTATRRCWLWDRFRRSVFNMTGMEPGQNGSMSLSTYIYTGALRRGQINRGSLGKWGGSGSFAFRSTTISFQWIQQGSLYTGSNKDLSTLDPRRISLHWIQQGYLCTGSNKDLSALDPRRISFQWIQEGSFHLIQQGSSRNGLGSGFWARSDQREIGWDHQCYITDSQDFGWIIHFSASPMLSFALVSGVRWG